MKKGTSYLEGLVFDPHLWDSLHAKWITNIRLVILLVLLVIAAGATAITTLPRRVNPEVKIPIVTVTTVLPGSSPEDVEQLISIPLENDLKGMDGLDRITSSSQNNVSTIVLEFVSTIDRDKARDDAQALVDSVVLPDDAQTPRVNTVDFENEPVWIFALSGDTDTPSLMRFSKTLQDYIEEISSVKEVTLSGFETQEITIDISNEKQLEYGLNAQDLERIVTQAAKAYPGGSVISGMSAYSITIDPFITTVENIRALQIPTKYGTVPLADIATVQERSEPNIQTSYSISPDKEPMRSVTFYVYKTPGANIDTTAQAVQNVVSEQLGKTNRTFQIFSIRNAGEEIGEQYNSLLGDFGKTLLLVFVVLLLFLGIRQAILASVTIPLTFLAGLVIMGMFGLSINFISMFAFLLALGTSIDDTIVTVSSMTSYYRSGKFSTQETGLLVWRDFIVPIWATTITTIWAFLPLILSTGIIGEFIKSIPIVVTATMISSTVFAVSVTLPFMVVLLKPSLPKRVRVLLKVLGIAIISIFLFILLPKSAVFPFTFIAATLFVYVLFQAFPALIRPIKKMRLIQKTHKRFAPLARHIFDNGFVDSRKISNRYGKIIRRILRSKRGRRNVLIAVCSFAVFSYLLLPLGLVKNEFFPKSNENILYMNIELPAGTRQEIITQEALTIAKEVSKNTEVQSVLVETGRSFTGDGVSRNANAAVLTLLLDHENPQSISLAQEFREKYQFHERSTVTIRELSGGPPAGADVQIKLLGEDLSTLEEYARTVQSYLRSREGVTNVELSVKPNTSKLVFEPDPQKLTENGITREQIGNALRSFLGGKELENIRFGTEETSIVLRGHTNEIPAEEISAVVVGQSRIPLASLGTFRPAYNPTVINREAGKRTLAVSAGVEAGFVIADINRDLETFADTKLSLPQGYTWQTGGVNEENNESVQSIFRAMGLSFMLILVTMVVLFGSYRQATIILLLIPLAISGVFVVFALTATPLSFPSLIGILALFGIVVTNAMFIVDSINRNRARGMDIIEAIADAGESRLEPITLTSFTTIFGLVPITLSDPIWRGLGGAIIAGLSSSGIIMLFFVPILYYSWFHNADNT